MELKGKTAVVTGGDSGIGEATCAALRAHGATPVSWDLSGDDVRCDVTDLGSIRAALEETVSRHGVPSVLVTSAGLAKLASLRDLTVELWDRMYAVNVRGTMLCMKVVSEAIEDAGIEGSFVLVSSVNGWISVPSHTTYSSGKAAIIHLARTAAVELGPKGIRVNTVAPGPTATPMLEGAVSDLDDYSANVAANTPLGRIGHAEDVAEAIVGILGMDWVTGQTLAADGGSSLTTPRGRIIDD